jgi:hypothetical protein
MMQKVKSAVWATLLLIAACANGLADNLSTSDSFPSGAASGGPTTGSDQAGSSTGSVAAGGAGSGGSGGAAGMLAGSTGTAGTNVSSGGSAGSAGANGAAGSASGNGNVGASGSAGSAPDAGDDVVADVTVQETGAAEASCVAESNAAFCLRLQKNCGDTTANDNCGSMMTVNCGTCRQLQACGGGGQSNVCGTLTSPQGGTVTSSSPGVAPEDMTKAFDGNTATKWFAGNGVKTGWIAFQFMPATSHTVTSYSISSANDVPARDPNAWQLQGSNDGQTWTTVDTRTGEMFAARFQTNKYTCTTPGAYSRYRLNVTANSGGTDLQLSELQLFGQ